MQSEEAEDVCHWLLRCPAWDHLRLPLVEEVKVSHCDGFQGQSLNKQAAFVYPWHALIVFILTIS